METEKDKDLWKMAKRRVGFKRHLATYIVINTMFWFIWYFSDNKTQEKDFPWPLWPMLGWGIGLAFDFMGTYLFHKTKAIEKEYKKLKGE